MYRDFVKWRVPNDSVSEHELFRTGMNHPCRDIVVCSQALLPALTRTGSRRVQKL